MISRQYFLLFDGHLSSSQPPEVWVSFLHFLEAFLESAMLQVDSSSETKSLRFFVPQSSSSKELLLATSSSSSSGAGVTRR